MENKSAASWKQVQILSVNMCECGKKTNKQTKPTTRKQTNKNK